MSNTIGSPIKITALINNKEVEVNFVSENPNSYQELKSDIEYLGTGYYFMQGEHRSKDSKLYHFWKYKNK